MNESIDMKRRAQTRQFCVRYGLRTAMSSVDGADDARYCESDCDESLREACRTQLRSYDWEFEPGEVRLLAKGGRLTYALVAQDMGDGQFLVIPFSSYASPASEGELLVQSPGGAGIRVLQVWNAKVWTRPSVAEGWRVGVLPEEDVEDSLSVWRWTLGLGAPSSEVVSRTGAKVAECEETVRRYLLEERKNLARIDDADARRFPWFIVVQGKPCEPIMAEPPHAVAAGEEKPCSDIRRAECLVGDFDGRVLAVYNHETGELSLDVFDAGGDPSAALDGWTLVDGAGNELAKIVDDGIRPVKVGEFDGSCFLIDGDAGVHKLSRVE